MDCLKIVHFHFPSLSMMQIFENSPILANHRNVYKKPSPTTIEVFLIPIFDIKQTCKIVPAENCFI